MVTFSKQLKLFCAIVLVCICFGLALSSCAARIAPAKDAPKEESVKENGDQPKLVTHEVLEDFHVKVPESIAVDTPFEMRITTIGSMGTKPYFEDGDDLEISLVSDVGRLEPASSKLQGGIGSMQLKLMDLEVLDSLTSESTSKSATVTVILKDLNQNLISKTITLNIQ